MARVSTYLNFQGQTEEAFAFYAKTFGTEVTMLSRYSDSPAAGPGELPAEERNLVMHADLPIIARHVLMATDMLRSMGQETRAPYPARRSRRRRPLSFRDRAGHVTTCDKSRLGHPPSVFRIDFVWAAAGVWQAVNRLQINVFCWLRLPTESTARTTRG